MYKHLLQMCLLVICLIGLLFHDNSKDLLVNTTQGPITLKLEQATTPLTRNLGLMWRRQLQDNQGMLFSFDHEIIQSFWMKNTHIPLDIIFLDSAYQIINIHKNAAPHDTSKIVSKKPSKYVIELAAGSTEKFGLTEGNKVHINH